MRALLNATIYVSPTEEPIRGGTILVDGGRIAAVGKVAVPPNIETIDCSGCTITAGFWNSHVHFFERKWGNVATIPAAELQRQLHDMLGRYGFTSVFDLSSMWENTRQLRDRIESGEVSGPRIRTTGEGLVPPGSVPDVVLNMMGVIKTTMAEVTHAASAAAAARKLLGAGVDGIKLFATWPQGAPLSAEAIRAAVDEAHRAGKPVFLHPGTGEHVLTAIRSGIDVIAHTTPFAGSWDARTKYYARHDRLSTQEKITSAAIDQLRKWIDAGATVLFGTDLGAFEYDPTEEYVLMSEAGMRFSQILASLTTTPASFFGESKVGRIAEGFEADLVVLEGDPSKDIRALAVVRYTLTRGKYATQNLS